MERSDNLSKRIMGLALATGILLLIPLVGMQFSDDVVWTLGDFIFAGVLLFGTGLAYLLISQKAVNATYKAAIGLALGSALFLIWSEGAVGIIGSPGGITGLMEMGILVIGFLGAILARLRPQGMARTLFTMALAQALIGTIAIFAGLGRPASPPLEIIGVSGMFITLFVGSGLLFRQSSQQEVSTTE